MRIKIRFSFLLYVGSIALFASPWAAAAAVTALVVHEMSHLIAIKLMGEHVHTLELTPFGGVMTYASSPQKGLKGLMVAFAGPLSNYIVLLILPEISCFVPQEFSKQLALSNAAMMLVNFIPAFPLDGGRMVFSVGYYVFGLSVLTKALTGLGVFAGGMMIAFGIYGAVMFKCLNLSIVLVGFYIVTCAIKCRTELFSENLFTLVQERLDAPKRVQITRVYTVPKETKLYQLIDEIGSCEAALFLINWKERVELLHEQDILAAMLSEPQRTISSLLDEKYNPHQKNA